MGASMCRGAENISLAEEIILSRFFSSSNLLFISHLSNFFPLKLYGNRDFIGIGSLVR